MYNLFLKPDIYLNEPYCSFKYCFDSQNFLAVTSSLLMFTNSFVYEASYLNLILSLENFNFYVGIVLLIH